MRWFFLLVFFAVDLVNGKTVRVADSSRGKLEKSVLIRHFENGHESTYWVKNKIFWKKGECQFIGEFVAQLHDMNFDGSADLWLTGNSDSQGRARCSDVWLWNSKKRKYVYSRQISRIPNLQIGESEKIIEGGVSNCGCAAQCFFHDTYVWKSGVLQRVARRQQDCVQYQESGLVGSELKVLKTEPIDDEKYTERQNGRTKFFDWSASAHAKKLGK